MIPLESFQANSSTKFFRKIFTLKFTKTYILQNDCVDENCLMISTEFLKTFLRRKPKEFMLKFNLRTPKPEVNWWLKRIGKEMCLSSGIKIMK